MTGNDLATNRSDGAGEEITRRAPRAVGLAGRALLVGFICFLSTELGFALKFPPHYISPLWPTGAILFSVLVATPVRHWWAYTLAAYFTSVINDARAGFPVSAALFIAAGILEILIAAAGVRRFAGGLRAFASLRSLVAYIVSAVLLAPFTSSFVAAFAGGPEQYWFYWRVWFLSEALAYLMLAPAILSLIGAAPTALRNVSPARCLEACLLGSGLLAGSVYVFSWTTVKAGSVPALVYLPLPFLLWAAVRFGPGGLHTSLLVVASMSISGAVYGRGPFVTSTPADNVLSLQLFLVVIALPLMFLAALIEERWEKTHVLSESEARFRTLADTAPVLIWMSGQNKLWTFLNRGWLDFTGRPLQQELGNGWLEGVHADDRDLRLRTYADAFDARQEFTLEYRLRRADGEYRWVLDKGVPRLAPDGTFLGYIGCADDISERKQAEEGLRESQRELRALTGRLLQAQEAERRRIARDLHDDLNQSLALLAVELDLLGQQPPDSATRFGERVQELLARVKELSSSVHDLSHQLHPSKLGQLGLVAAVRGLCKELTQGHGLPIEFTHHEVPEAVPEDAALCLYRIVQEALRNAIRHSGTPRARVALTGSAGAIRLQIVDDGIGFDPTAADGKGGLGLVSMRERLHHVSGEIVIDSRPSGGTRIDVRIPRRAAGQTEAALPVQPARIA